MAVKNNLSKEPGIQNISSIIREFEAADSDFSRKIKTYSIFNHWDEIVGNEIGKKSSPVRIIKDTLYITVTNPIWANELSLLSNQLIMKINSFTGLDTIKKLRFKIKS